MIGSEVLSTALHRFRTHPLQTWLTLAGLIVVLHIIAAGCAVAVLPGTAGLLLGTALLALGAAAAWSRALLRSDGAVTSQ